MRDWVVTIPSYKRADVLATQTLPMLAEGGVPADRIYLGIAIEELTEYQSRLDPGMYGEIIPHDRPGSFHGACEVLQAHFTPGDIVSMDDDVKRLDRKVDDKTLEPVQDVASFFDEGFDLLDRHYATLWGIYPVRNALFMKHRIRTDLVLCVGHCYGHRVSGRACESQWSDFANDYERSLSRFMADGLVVRREDVAAHSKVYSQAGGLQGIRNPANKEADIQRLSSQFPGLVARKKVKGDMPEMRLVQPK